MKMVMQNEFRLFLYINLHKCYKFNINYKKNVKYSIFKDIQMH